jgi:hypothetical protein
MLAFSTTPQFRASAPKLNSTRDKLIGAHPYCRLLAGHYSPTPFHVQLFFPLIFTLPGLTGQTPRAFVA